MKLIKIYNCRAITASRILSDATVIVKDGVIEELTTGKIEVNDAKEIDGNGLYVSPGFIDLHTHGAGNHDFMDGSVEAYLEAACLSWHYIAISNHPDKYQWRSFQ